MELLGFLSLRHWCIAAPPPLGVTGAGGRWMELLGLLSPRHRRSDEYRGTGNGTEPGLWATWGPREEISGSRAGTPDDVWIDTNACRDAPVCGRGQAHYDFGRQPLLQATMRGRVYTARRSQGSLPPVIPLVLVQKSLRRTHPGAHCSSSPTIPWSHNPSIIPPRRCRLASASSTPTQPPTITPRPEIDRGPAGAHRTFHISVP